MAVKSFWTSVLESVIMGSPFNSEQMANEATAFDTTVAFPSFSKFYNNFKKPCSSIKVGDISYNLGTHKAPVFLT